MNSYIKMRVALDWTPNINHIGFFIAKEKGFYRDLDLEVELLSPASDNYATTPAKKVELDESDIALCPTESVISYRTKEVPFDLLGIATIYQDDLSAIAVRSDSGIMSPRDLDGKRYASYKARYEDQIVKQMIINDGGEGSIEIGYPEKLSIWQTLLKEDYHSTWIFLNWEGIDVETKNIDLRYFRMKDYKIPYSYSPLIVGSENHINENQSLYVDFLSATKKGFLYAVSHPEESVNIMRPFIPDHDADIDLYKALSVSATSYGDDSNWGHMKEEVINDFLSWIYKNNLETQQLNVQNLITNKMLNVLS